MSTRRGAKRWTRRAVLAALLAAAGALLAHPPAEAQEADRRDAPDVRAPDDGWLGVGLLSISECREGSAAPGETCRRTLVVGGLVHGGPADRAGLQPGDTLLAVDGSPVDDDGAFRRLSAGDTVSIRVGRPGGGRAQLEVVPAARPDSLAVVRYHRDASLPAGGARYLLAVPEPAVLDSLASPAQGGDGGWFGTRVSVVPAERVRQIPLQAETGGVADAAGASERVAEMRARARELQRRALEETRELRMELTEPRGGAAPDAEEWKRWVSEELRPRLQVVYDSVLTEARERMDSLRSVYPAIAARAARTMDSLYPGVAGGAAERNSARRPPAPPRPKGRAPELPPSPEELGMPGNRIAGAELQSLNPRLAQFFDGAERGLVVLEVLPGTPAFQLGLRPGDVIVEADGRPVSELSDLRRTLVEHSPVEIRWVRRGRTAVDTLRR